MAHSCGNLIVHCIDFRLAKKIKEYMEEKGLLGDCDVVSVAGGVKETSFVLKQIGISVSLHHTKKIILLNHTDCGAYGGKASFASAEKERDFHIEEMKKAKNLILEKFSGITVSLALAKIGDTGEVEIEEIN